MGKNWEELKSGLDKAVLKRAGELFAVRDVELRLGELRKARKMSQAALCKKIGMKQSQLSRIESAGDIQLSTLVKIVNGLGYDLEVRARGRSDARSHRLLQARSGR